MREVRDFLDRVGEYVLLGGPQWSRAPPGTADRKPREWANQRTGKELCLRLTPASYGD